MKSYKEWNGSKVARGQVVDYILAQIRQELFPELSRQEVSQLFIEAFFRNVVQAELREMMIYIHEEENSHEEGQI